MKRPGRLALVLIACLLAGCAVDTSVSIDVHDDGSGLVRVRATLDEEAVRAAEAGGGSLEDRVRLDDLSAAGWEVGRWVRTPPGLGQIVLTKEFASPEQLAGIVHEVSGPDGPLRDVQAARDRGLTSTRYAVTGALDLAAIQTGVLGDQELVDSLSNQQVDVAAVDRTLLEELRNAVSVSVVIRLPGGATMTVDGVMGQRLPFEATTSVLETRRLVLLGVAALLLVLAVVVLLVGRGRRRAPIRRFEVHAGPG